MVVSIRASQRLEAIPTYEPGLTTAEVLARYGLSAAIKLASNESPYPPLDAVQAVVRGGVESLNRYPDAYGRVLRAQLAERHHVEIDQVVLGNGSCELILLAGQALLDPATTVVHADPSFAIYPHLAAASGAEAIAVPLEDDGGHDLMTMAAHVDERTRLVIVCNPNNPTGTYNTLEEFVSFLRAVPKRVVVAVDEAYYEYVTAPDYPQTLSLREEYPNLVALRTFSKIHSLAGLRIGYRIGHADLVTELHKTREPFNVNSLSQAAALACLENWRVVPERALRNERERERLAAHLKALGFRVTPSQANFLLARCDGNAGQLTTALLHKGVIVRPMHAFGLGEGALRISVGLPEENDRCVAALREILS